MSKDGSSVMTFDKQLAQVIEALGQLAAQHTKEIEDVARKAVPRRIEPGKSNGDCCRVAPISPAVTATVSCDNNLDIDPIHDAILSEHEAQEGSQAGSMTAPTEPSIATEIDYGVPPALATPTSHALSLPASAKQSSQYFMARQPSPRMEPKSSGMSLAYMSEPLSPRGRRPSQTESGFKFDCSSSVAIESFSVRPASPTVGDLDEAQVFVEVEDENDLNADPFNPVHSLLVEVESECGFDSDGPREQRPSIATASVGTSARSVAEGQWTLIKSNAYFQLKKLWIDHLDLDRYKLAEVETSLLKEARWIRHDGLPSNEGVDLSETRAINKAAFKTIEDMRKACQSHPDCVGFAYWPKKGWCFPKKAGTGFEPDTATFTQKHKNEIWEWHYMPSRAQASKRKSDLHWDTSWSVKTDLPLLKRRYGDIDYTMFERCVLHPTSKWRAVWLLISMILLGYDIIMVPVSVCFETDRGSFDNFLQLFGSVFWTSDIVLTFCTGVLNETSLEMRPLHIARMYAKSWLIFDCLLAATDWVHQATSEPSIEPISVARALRWARTLRLLRLVRLLRFSKFMPIFRRLLYQYNLDKQGIAVFGVWLNMTLLLLCAVHLTACLWHVLGDELSDGWIAVNHFNSGSVIRRYAISLRWTVGRLHGMEIGYDLQNTSEMMMDSLLIFFSLFAASVYAGQVNALSMSWARTSMFSMRKLAYKYSYQHQISLPLQKRMHNFLRAAHYGGAVQMAEDEERLLSELPRVLQEDLLFEARMRFIRVKHFFEDMFWLSPRAVQHLCKEAFSVVIAMVSEKIFAGGEACSRMVFVTSGACWYNCDAATLKATPRPFDRHPASDPCHEFIQKGAALSEASLWTQWVHTGTLSANEETMLLGLDANVFGNVVLQHIEACLHAVKYGRRFVRDLNRIVQSDLVDFSNLRLDDLDQDFSDGSEDRHLAFISHYKLEAGTEATLMRDTLEQILKEDPANDANFFLTPVFVDSENLEDLATLKGHVESSEAMLLLLTPQVLSRPWCLFEIATAVAAHIKIVPVEIQSPQFRYQYPDEKFYARLSSGRLLNKEAHNLLRNAGFELEAVEHAVREVHMKIALPFSPHKSRNVRHAELQDILRRCTTRDSNRDIETGRSAKNLLLETASTSTHDEPSSWTPRKASMR